jgi:hypothetical protein
VLEDKVIGPAKVKFDELVRRGRQAACRAAARTSAACMLSDRMKRLGRLLAKRRVGIVLSTHTDEDGGAIFQQACRMGLGSSCRSYRFFGSTRRAVPGCERPLTAPQFTLRPKGRMTPFAVAC